MKKIIALIENQIQWLLLGVAGLFVLLSVVRYLIGTPVSVDMAGDRFGPGEVDAELNRRAAEPLDNRLKQEGTVEIPVPRMVDQFASRMAEAPIAQNPAATVFARAHTKGLTPGVSSSDLDNLAIVERLPLLPAASIDEVSTGLAQVAFADRFDGVPENRDLAWVRVQYTVDLSAVARELTNAGIPPTVQSTSFLEVELVRQRLLSNGEWGEETVVAKLAPVAAAKQAFPGPEADINVRQRFITWAQQNQGLLVQPPFYPVIAGANPDFIEPPEQDLGELVVDGPINPQQFYEAARARGEWPKALEQLNAEDRAAVRRYVADLLRQEAERRRQPTGGGNRPTGGPGGGSEFGPAGGGRGGRGGGPGGFAAPSEPTLAPAVPFLNRIQDRVPASDAFRSEDSNGNSVVLFQQRNQMPPQGPFGPGGMPGEFGPGGFQGGEFGPGFPGQGQVPGQPNLVQRQIPQVPQGPFQPSTVFSVTGWAWDETAVPEQTYRYRVRYRLQNPLLSADPNLVQVKPEVLKELALTGEDVNVWSDDVRVAPVAHVFLAANPSAGSARMTVFRWSDGKLKKDVEAYAPGDSIGKKKGETDFSTTWTLVDIRSVGGSDRRIALLVGPDGNVISRDFESDRNDEELKKLEAELAAAEGQPAQPPAGSPPFGVPPGGRFPG
jgi:hypothetical protein